MRGYFKNCDSSCNGYNCSCPNNFCKYGHCFNNICLTNNSFINSLFCVENFLCNYKKACDIYKIFCLFK